MTFLERVKGPSGKVSPILIDFGLEFHEVQLTGNDGTHHESILALFLYNIIAESAAHTDLERT